mmetsp:Transcript_29601/g.43443  ORF Transcript_29601/g.43443 Transcript_29601/m.43443 type:complete len:223 (-) Transcript_29601:47-715(-)
MKYWEYYFHLHVWESVSGEDRLGGNSTDSHHSKTSILQLPQLHPVNFFFRLSNKESKGVKSEVTRFTSRSLKHLADSDPRQHFGNSNEKKDLSHSTSGNCGIMSSSRGSSLHGLGERVDLDTLVNSDESTPCKHSNTAVLELGLAKVVHGEVITDAKGVESYISDVSLEVLGSREERKSLRLFGSAQACGGASSSRGSKSGSSSNKAGRDGELHLGSCWTES